MIWSDKMWIIAIVASLAGGMIAMGLLLPSSDFGLVIAVFAAVLIMGGFIMYQLKKVRQEQDELSKSIKELLEKENSSRS